MKSGWQLKPLSDLCGFQRGLTYAKSDEVSESRNVVLRANNVDLESNNLLLEDLRYIADSVVIPSDKRVKKGSMLICTASGSKSHLGKVAYVDRDMDYAFGGFMGQITPNDEIDGRYLFYALTAPAYKEFIAALSDGANINNLKFNDLGNYLVGVPDLAEQQRIVAILDEAFAEIATAKANAEKNLQNARALFESHLQSVFADSCEGIPTTLGEAYDVRDGTHDSPKFHDTGYPLVTSKNLKRDGLNFDAIKFISEQDYRKINERSAVNVGDVLFAMIGTIGNPVVVEDEPNFAIKNVALFKVPGDQDSRFLRYFLSSEITLSRMKNEANGTTQKFVGLGYLRKFPVKLPNLEKQRQLVKELDDLSAETQRLESIYQQKLAALDELKKSLLHQAFSGAL